MIKKIQVLYIILITLGKLSLGKQAVLEVKREDAVRFLFVLPGKTYLQKLISYKFKLRNKDILVSMIMQINNESHMFGDLSLCISLSVYVCAFACKWVHMFANVCVCVSAWACVCMCVYLCVRKHKVHVSACSRYYGFILHRIYQPQRSCWLQLG